MMRGKKWTLQENAYMREHWGSKLATEIAKALNRTLSGVYFQAHKLGLRPKTGYHPKGLTFDHETLALAPGHQAVDAYSFACWQAVLSSPPIPNRPQEREADSHCAEQAAMEAPPLDLPV